MSAPFSSLRLCYPTLTIVAVLAISWLTAPVAGAQTQESGLLNRIEHPDTTLKFEPADKSFTGRSALGSKEATVRPFAFSRPATLRSNDALAQSYRFGDKDKFRTDGFATKADRVVGGDAFAQTDRRFGTKALPVQEAIDAGKSAPFMRDYLPGQRASSSRGKRQDTIDDLRNQKDLSIDEVREILNKPNGRPGAHPATETLPVMRALPVTSPSAR